MPPDRSNSKKSQPEETFSPDDFILIVIQRAIKNLQNICITKNTGEYIIILGQTGEYLDKTDDLKSFCQQPLTVLKVKLLAKVHNDHDRKSLRNIDELMWSACFYISDGRLMRGCYRDDVVELTQWPNLTRLPCTPNTMRLASLLSHHPTSLTLAQRSLLKINKEEAYQFYSAARFAGYARAINRPQEKLPQLKPHRNQTLLSLLLRKVVHKVARA